ncbi:MAG: hypothetical protein ACQZ3N_00485 [cyanobacterium endosymbiont of Rhopalodia yunnanensis]
MTNNNQQNIKQIHCTNMLRLLKYRLEVAKQQSNIRLIEQLVAE